MNTLTERQENLRRVQAKKRLGLPLTERESAFVTLFGQNVLNGKEDKPAFVEK